MTWFNKFSKAVWLPLSAGARYGAGCTKTPFGRGTTAAGYFPATRTSLPKPAAYWISMPASGKKSH